MRNSDTYGTFKNIILKFLGPSPNIVFKCHHPKGIKFLTRRHLGLSHLREHIFKHGFQDSVEDSFQDSSAVIALNQLHISRSTTPFTTMIGLP